MNNAPLKYLAEKRNFTPFVFARHIDSMYLNRDSLLNDGSISDVVHKSAKAGCNVRSVCVYPKHISTVAGKLIGSEISPCAQIDKGNLTRRLVETRYAKEYGAKEFDFVLDSGMGIDCHVTSYLIALSPDMDKKFNDRDIFMRCGRYFNDFYSNPEDLVAKIIIGAGDIQHTAISIKGIADGLLIPRENLYVGLNTSSALAVMDLKEWVRPYGVKVYTDDVDCAINFFAAGADRVGTTKPDVLIRKFKNLYDKL